MHKTMCRRSSEGTNNNNIYIKKVRVIFQLTGFLKSNIKLGSIFLKSTFLSRDPGPHARLFPPFLLPRICMVSSPLIFFHLCACAKRSCQGLVLHPAAPPCWEPLSSGLPAGLRIESRPCSSPQSGSGCPSAADLIPPCSPTHLALQLLCS